MPADFPKDKLNEILHLVRERLEKLSDIENLTSFFYREIKQEERLLLKKSNKEDVITQLNLTKDVLSKIDDWNTANIETVIRNLQENNDWKKGQYFMMVRITVTGKKATPPLFETMEIIDKDVVLKRFDQAIALLAN